LRFVDRWIGDYQSLSEGLSNVSRDKTFGRFWVCMIVDYLWKTIANERIPVAPRAKSLFDLLFV